MTILARLALAAALLAGTAASTLADEPLHVGATFLTDGLDPARGSNGWALVSHGIGENLFTVDRDGQLVPELAESAERLNDLAWRVTLKAERFFSDGTPVTADLVATALTHTIATNPAARATSGQLSFEAEGESALLVTTERPVPVIEALFAEWPLIVYKLEEDGSAAFSGPYQVADFQPDVSLSLTANPHFPDSEARSDVELRRFGDGQSMALAFEAGDLDLAFGLPSEVVARLEAQSPGAIKSFPVGYQYMAIFNTERSILSDTRVRRALDLAFDREELALAINAGEPSTGPFAPYFPFTRSRPRETDLDRAAALLDEAGWRREADDVRRKNGEPLRLSVLAYPQRPDLVTLQPVIAAQFARLGVEVATRVVENANDAAAGGDFDLFLWAQHTAPSGDPAFFFESTLRSGASLNHSGYADPTFDAILDRFAREGKAQTRSKIALDAQDRLFEQVPVSFLLSPTWFVGVSERLAGYEPWGSDYHVLRADIGESR